MRVLVIFSAFLILCSCKQTTEDPFSSEESIKVSTEADVSFDWLLGKWKRMNEEAGKSTFEFWEKAHKNEYSGFGFTLKNGDTIWQESMRLSKDEETWALFIKGTEDPEPVIFKMTFSNGNGFTCENPEIEFPKKIKYLKTENGIRASVSNNEMEIPFAFERLNE